MLAPGGRARGPAIQLSSAGVSLRTLSPRPVIGCAVWASCACPTDPVIELPVIMKMATAALGKKVLMCHPPWGFLNLRRVCETRTSGVCHKCYGCSVQSVPMGSPARAARASSDEVLPDRHGVATAAESQLDELAVRRAGTRGRGPVARRRPRRELRKAWRARPGVG